MRRAERGALSDPNIANLLGALATLIEDGVEAAVALEPGELPKRTALALIAKYPGCSIEELRGPLALSHSGCVRLVDRAVDAGLVERRPSEDGRAVALHLTRRGRTANDATVECREKVLQRALGVLSEDERDQLGAIATKLLDSVVAPQAAMRTCRFCDYDACVTCPMQKFASSDHVES